MESVNNEVINNSEMNELIKVEQKQINNAVISTVSARELHEFLGVGRDFSNWIKGRIEKYEFSENVDYVIVQNLSSPNLVNAKSRAQTLKEYYLTLDMAKELCMVENNQKGREARKYFIECEKKLREVALSTKDKLLLNVLRAESDIDKALALRAYDLEYVRPLEIENERMKPKEEFYDAVVQSDSTLDLGSVAKILNYKGMGRNNLLKYLREHNVLNHKNVPYQQFVAQGYFKLVESSWVNPYTQELEVFIKPVVFQKGIEWLDKKLKDAGYKKLKINQ